MPAAVHRGVSRCGTSPRPAVAELQRAGPDGAGRRGLDVRRPHLGRRLWLCGRGGEGSRGRAPRAADSQAHLPSGSLVASMMGWKARKVNLTFKHPWGTVPQKSLLPTWTGGRWTWTQTAARIPDAHLQGPSLHHYLLGLGDVLF